MKINLIFNLKMNKEPQAEIEENKLDQEQQ